MTLRRLTDADADLAKLAGPSFLAAAREPIAIEVVTERELGRLDRTSSPEIVLNGTRVGDTRAIDATHLVAFLSDRRRIRARNSVTVVWLGNEAASQTRRPLSFTAQEVR